MEEEIKLMSKDGGILFDMSHDEPVVTYNLDKDYVKKAAEKCADEHGLLKKEGKRNKDSMSNIARDIFIEGYVAGCAQLFEEMKKPILKISTDEEREE